MITIEFRAEAEAEIRDAFAWYEEKCQGLGLQFLVSLDAVLARIGRHPGGFPVVEDAIRKALIRRFPYALYFTVDGTRVIVVAVYHGQRRPRSWADRVSEPFLTAYAGAAGSR